MSRRRPAAARGAGAFSLIEVMAAIMLLTVLLMAAFPAFRGMQRAAYRQRAAADCRALAQAATAYRRVYGQWPGEEAVVDATLTALVAGRDLDAQQLALSNVVAVLRAADRVRNPRGTLFLEVSDDRLDTDGTLLDPWRQPYVLVLARAGVDGRGTAVISRREGGVHAAVTRGGTSQVVDSPDEAAAFSWGDPASPHVIASWSETP